MKRRTLAIIGVLLLALPAVAGTWTPNNFIYKPSIGARGEVEKQTFDSSLDRIDARLGKVIWVGDPNYGSTLSSAITAIGANNVILRVPAATHGITANLTVPANITLQVERGAILSIATGVTLNINGGFEAGPYQCLSRTGTGQVVFGAGSVQEVKVVWFGTNTDAITHAFSAVPSGADLRFIAGYNYTFSPSSTVTITGKSINIICDPAVVIDATGATANTVLTLTGSIGTHYVLGGAITKGDSSFTVDSTLAASLSSGDIVKLTTNSAYGGSGTLWSATRTMWFKGELVKVLSVSGNTVTITGRFCDDYVATDTVAAKITPITGSLNNFRMKGLLSRQQQGVYIWYTKDYVVKDSEIKGFGSHCLDLYYGYNPKVDNFTSSDFRGGTTSDYGLSLNTCYHAKVLNSNIEGGRHAITTGGWEPNRFMNIGPNNSLANHSTSIPNALGPHENGEYLKVFNNHIVNGLAMDGRNWEVTGNTVYIGHSGYPGIQAYINESCDYFKIDNNTIIGPAQFDGAGAAGIQIITDGARTINNAIINGNNISGYCHGVYIYVSTAHSPIINNLDILNNTTNLTSTTVGHPVYFSGNDTTHLIQVDVCNILNNNFSYNNRYGLYGRWVSINDLHINNNIFKYNSSLAGYDPIHLVNSGSELPISVKRAQVSYNSFYNVNNKSNYVYINAGSDYIEFTHNQLNNFALNGGARLAARDILVSDNQQFNGYGSYSLTGRYYSKVFSNFNVVSWGTAVPTTGAWKQGDIIERTDVAAGGAAGWKCITTGTFSALSVTGDTDGSTSTITNISDTSGVNVGDWVNVLAGFPTTGPHKVLSKTATTITLSTASNSAQSGVTVDTSYPVFKAMANLAS
jgi:hypothetical protein